MRSRYLSILLVLMLVLSSFTFAFADDYDYLDDIKSMKELKDLLEEAKADDDEELIEAIEERIENREEEEEIEAEDEEEEEDETISLWEKEKDEIEEDKDIAEEEKEKAKELWEEAIEDGAEQSVIEDLYADYLAANNEFLSLKEQLREKIMERRTLILDEYTEEEIEALEDAEDAINDENPEDTVIPFNNIFAKGHSLKFDTPPVIRHNRTLIPVRAITEGFGATVSWDPETEEVTITKDGVVIVLNIDSTIAAVGNESVEIDSEATIMNSRTYVPLRFILETFGLKVNWDEDTETIEIEEEEE